MNIREDLTDNFLLDEALKELRELQTGEPTDEELYQFLKNYEGGNYDLNWYAGYIAGKESNESNDGLRHFIYAGVLHYGSASRHFCGSITNQNSFPSFDFIRNDMIKRTEFPETSGMTLSFIQEVSIEDAVDYMK